MSLESIIANLLTAPPLFFLLGVMSVLLKTNLVFPQPIPKLLSLYLLFSIGLRGGNEIYRDGFSVEQIPLLCLAIGFSLIVPAIVYFVLQKKLGKENAAVIGSSYGSVSTVTFITGLGYMGSYADFGYSGILIAALALMEGPAIITGIILGEASASKKKFRKSTLIEALKGAFLNYSVYILFASLIVGFLLGNKGWEGLKPVFSDPFKGILSLFLVDMGIVAAHRIDSILRSGWTPFLFSVITPLILGSLSISICFAIGTSQTDAFLFSLLAAGASYIAVPAVMRSAIPKANPGLYITMPLGLTLPFNLAFGIPIYWQITTLFW